MVCRRCKTIMYLQKSGASANHKRGYCSDGGPVSLTRKANENAPPVNIDSVPPWPQPLRIFTEGAEFHVRPFVRALRELYDMAVIKKSKAEDFSLEGEAFARMFMQHTQVIDDVPYFRLFSLLKLDSRSKYTLLEHNGQELLRLDSLRDD